MRLNAFMRKSGVSENSSVAHELRNLVQIVRLAISYDQLDPANVASIEQAVRRIHEIQQAVHRNLKHPDFSGLSIGTIGSSDEIGGTRLHEYSQRLGSKQKEEANTLEAQRKWREEQAAERRRTSDRDQPQAKTKTKAKSFPAAAQEGGNDVSQESGRQGRDTPLPRLSSTKLGVFGQRRWAQAWWPVPAAGASCRCAQGSCPPPLRAARRPRSPRIGAASSRWLRRPAASTRWLLLPRRRSVQAALGLGLRLRRRPPRPRLRFWNGYVTPSPAMGRRRRG